MSDKEKPEFDASLSPESEQNREAAKAHNLRYDSDWEMYVDEDGCPIRDKFGQPI